MDDSQPTSVPYGHCHCGCGGKTTVAPRTITAIGWRKDEPNRYIRGHNVRKPIRWAERDCGHDTPCWVWQLSLAENGYGQHWDGDRYWRAHVYVYTQSRGPVPDGLVLDHLCRNRACVNPDHLEPVTHEENCHRGAGTKLTAEDVRAIRVASGTQREIAERFGISPAQISRIRTGARWTSID